MSKDSGLRWTEEELAAHRARARQAATNMVVPRAKASPAPAATLPADVARLVRVDEARKRFQALGRLPKDKKNGTETAYAELLEQRKHQGIILDWKFHPMNVRLADRTFYEVDFLVLAADLSLEIHETKGGHTTEKGQMKIKLCAEALPWFRFWKATKLPKKAGGGWKMEEF